MRSYSGRVEEGAGEEDQSPSMGRLRVGVDEASLVGSTNEPLQMHCG